MHPTEPPVIIDQRFHGDVVLSKKSFRGRVIPVMRDCDDAHVMLRCKSDKSRQFLATWTAPRRPEMQQRHRRAAKIDIDGESIPISWARRSAGYGQHQQYGDYAKFHGMNPRIVLTVAPDRFTRTSTFR